MLADTFVVKFRVFWDVAPWRHVEVDRHFRGSSASIVRPDDGSSTHLWNVGQLNVTTRRYIPEDSKLHTYRNENLKYALFLVFVVLFSSLRLSFNKKCILWPDKTAKLCKKIYLKLN
jgi:hypothetical protein